MFQNIESPKNISECYEYFELYKKKLEIKYIQCLKDSSMKVHATSCDSYIKEYTDNILNNPECFILSKTPK